MIEHRWHLLYYEHVPLWLWPAVWWQLREIDRWSAHFQRRVFVEVEPDGKVYSVWWEGMHDRWDEETHEKLSWSPSDLDPYLPGRLSTALASNSVCPGLDPGYLSTCREASMEIPGQARDERVRGCLPLGLPVAVPIPGAPQKPG